MPRVIAALLVVGGAVAAWLLVGSSGGRPPTADTALERGEGGSQGPALRGAGPQVAAEPSAETPTFAARVRARVQDVRDGEIVAAAMVGGNHCDAGVIAARSSMLHAVVSQMVTVGRGQVFLDGGSGSGRARHSMQAIADALEEQVAHTGVDVFTSGVEALRNAA